MPFRVGTNRIGRLVVGALPPSWNPGDIATYWWTADAGVTESGGDVSAWVDQVGSLSIGQGTAANQPTLVTSTNLNNQNAVRFTRANNEWLFRDPISFSGVGYAFSVINVYYLGDDTNAQGIVTQTVATGGAGRYALAIFGSGELGYVNQSFQSSTTTILEGSPTTGVKVDAFEYDASGNVRVWHNDLSSATSYSGGTSNLDLFQSTKFAFGAYYDASGTAPDSGRYFEGDLAESIWVTGTLSAGDLTNLQTYINNKYNLSV